MRLDSLCHDIKEAALPPVSTPEQRRKGWISEESWRLIDQKNALRRLPGRLNQTASRYLTRCLKASLQEDRKARAAAAGALAEAELNQDPPRIKEAWNVIRRWFISVEDRPLPPSSEDLSKVTNDRIKLYSKSLPPNRLSILVAPFDIDDVVPDPDEIADAIRGLRNGKSPGPSNIRAEHLKEWLKEAYQEHHPYQGNWNRDVDLI